MSAREDRIRDKLSTRLDLIEESLSLIRVNYPLPNSAGTRGFIDILAHDRHGVFVVIELKRSGKTAREALHEVMKYTELLQRERGIESANIRAVIVSTHWDELRVPFAHFKRGWSNEIRGYALTLDQDQVTPVSTEEVRVLAEAPIRGISPVHLVIFPKAGNTIDMAWRESTKILSAIGADDALGVELSHDDAPRLLYQSCLYLIIGSMIADDPRTIVLDEWRELIPDNTIEAPAGYALEYRALCQLTSGYDYDKVEIEMADPEKFAGIRSQNWQICRVLRAGIFDRQGDLYSDEALLRKVAHQSGHSEVRYAASSRPANHVHFADFRKNIAHCLTRTDAWRDCMLAWLDEVAATTPEVDVFCHVYNLCDFIKSILFGWPDRLGAYIPYIRAGIDAPISSRRMLVGALTWNGEHAQVSDVVHSIYAEPLEWAAAAQLGFAWERDIELLESLNLKYSLIEWSDEHEYGAIVSLANGHLVRTATNSILADGRHVFESVWPVQEFMRIHAGDVQLVVNEFRSTIAIVTEDGRD
jgi:hypothetical protein